MINYLRYLFLGILGLTSFITHSSEPFVIKRGAELSICLPDSYRTVLSSAMEILNGDLKSVFDCTIVFKQTKASVNVSIDSSYIKSPQGFQMKVFQNGTLSIIGHDSHGAAYGLMELSRLIGVSPWEWWADAVPEKKELFELPAGYVSEQSPSVEYRGIFINDEDWGLMPWSSKTMEPENKRGVIGARTTEKIFELMLRLRANYYWPPMHECSEPFFLTPGNREMAKKYGIYIGGSHCEPMASSTAVEWHRRGKGDYDYVNNSANVLKFWENRLKDVFGQEIVYTLGMRGIHDGAMNGAKTIEEQKQVLSRAIADQRALLRKYVGSNLEKVPQVFIPYKEILDVYNDGLEVPDDVTLMWCDDNYGYIRHFPTAEERSRKGGNGIYYHLSYWGRPHDYLWLGTFSPGLLYQQMKLAYDKGIQKMWILNVGDIKPSEYQIELFMDMAWNIDEVTAKGVSGHLYNFLQREFGDEVGQRLLPVMNEHYRLAFIRKPEFMGNTREEEWNNPVARVVKDLHWSESQINGRLTDYKRISDEAERIFADIPANRRDEYFQLVKYPVQAAAQMNNKILYAQLARHGKADWSLSDFAFDSIASLTRIYNKGFSNNGKWNGIMDMQPRKLPVFERVAHVADSVTMYNELIAEPLLTINANEAKGDYALCEGLGYNGTAIALKKNSLVTFELPSQFTDSVVVELCFIPTHPVCGDAIMVKVLQPNNGSQIIDYATKGRSEEWKENVLNNRSVRHIIFYPAYGNNKLTLIPLTDGVVLDCINIKTQ